MKIKVGMRKMSMGQIAKICGCQVTMVGADAPTDFDSICTDSREAGEYSLFLALRGEKVDGHSYILNALGNGCTCVLCEYLPESLKNRGLCFSALIVPDVIKALGAIAMVYGRHTAQKKVAVTGSVGKTTTKEMIASVLAEQYRVHKTEGNHNSTLGMPLSLLAADKSTQVSVLEMGMSGLGEIDFMSRVAEPDIAVITNIGSSHLEMLGSRENICSAKMEIVHGMHPGGKLILNGDEPLLCLMKGSSYEPIYVSVTSREADYRAMNIRYTSHGMLFDMIYGRRVATNVEIPVLGDHHVYNALFAWAVGVEMGVSEDAIRRGLKHFHNTGMRQRVIEWEGVTILEDCYNASPESMRAALRVLDAMISQVGSGRKIALLGDMKDLGPDSADMHRAVGAMAADTDLDLLITYGDLAVDIALEAVMHGVPREKVIVMPESKGKTETARVLRAHLRRGDCLLVKASRAMAMEDILTLLKQGKPGDGAEEV
jgi:UDP-N-acetylmuramoyl-tripeptide--D-alanyl-D-alanine ligase